MPSPGSNEAATASIPTSPNLYFAQNSAVAAKNPGEVRPYATPNVATAPLMFGTGTATTNAGETIVSAANSSKGHWSEVFNFHGSPAPWLLIGLLLAAGILHLEAQGKLGVKGRL
jgi:H+/gluconate symporter-like permease